MKEMKMKEMMMKKMIKMTKITIIQKIFLNSFIHYTIN